MSELRYLANQLYLKRCPEAKELTTGFVQKFVERHSLDIKKRKGKDSHKKNVLLSRYSVVEEWIKEAGMRLFEEVTQDYLLFNIDETKALPKSMADSVIAAAGLPEAHTNQVENSALYTLISCVSASGDVLFCVYIFRKPVTKKLTHMGIHVPIDPESPSTRSNREFPIYYAATSSGYLNAELWRSLLTVFLALVEPLQGLGRQRRAVLFIDGCSSHRKVDTIEPLSRCNVLVIYFPSNTSHILQPLDGYIFACYKPGAARGLQLLSLQALVFNEFKKHLVLKLSIDAAKKAFTPKIIKASFRDRGIHPWDPELILANTLRSTGSRPPISVPEEEFDRYSFDVLFQEYIDHLRDEAETKKVFLEAHNIASPSKQLPTAVPRAPSKKTVSKPRTNKKIASETIEEIKENDPELEIDQMVGILAKLVPDDDPDTDDTSDANCSNCDHQTRRHKLCRLCFDCNKLWLCRACSFQTEIVEDHFKTAHPGAAAGAAARPRRHSRAAPSAQ